MSIECLNIIIHSYKYHNFLISARVFLWFVFDKNTSISTDRVGSVLFTGGLARRFRAATAYSTKDVYAHQKRAI